MMLASRRIHALACAASLVLTLAVPTIAGAQPRTVLVLPWSLVDADAAVVAARGERVTGAISTGDLSAISVADARERFEQHGSSEPPTISDSDLDRWLSLSRQAVRQLANTDYAAAATTLREAQALSEPAAAELNREETRARQVLDTCLFEVRGLVETSDPRAETRALECRRLVPRIAPSPYIHTPEVVGLMARIDRRLADAPPGSLRIESAPSECRVRLNGIPLGNTPFVSEDLATGEYRAQIECGEEGTVHRGRVHRINLSEGASTVRIDARFDDAVRTDTALRLMYTSPAAADAHRLTDALTVAATIGAAEVWLVSADDSADADVVRIDRVNVASSDVLASVRTRLSSGLATAVVSLSHGDSEDRTGDAVVAIAPWGSAGTAGSAPIESQDPLPARADWEIGLGVALGAIGVGAIVTSFVLVDTERGYGHLATQPLVTDPDYQTRRAQWIGWEPPTLALGLTGGVLTAAALPFLMSNEHGTPWWSWLVGGVGAVTIGVGLGVASSTTGCGTDRPTDACVSGTAQTDLGVSIASIGIPLLTVPFVLLIRDAMGSPRVTPSASVSAHGASISLGGTW